MPHKQLHAGYIIENILNAFKSLIYDRYHGEDDEQERQNKIERIRKLVFQLSHFELETTNELPEIRSDSPPILSVASNIISRGLPTRMSYNLEKVFEDKFNYLVEFNELGGRLFKLKEGGLDTLRQFGDALYIIDPRIDRENAELDYEKSFENLDSAYEEDFLLKKLPEILGDHFIQLIDTQRPLNEIIQMSRDNGNYNTLENNFYEQRVDFAIQFPNQINGKYGIIIEIDGSQHNEPGQQHLDNLRDQVTESVNWIPIRIKTNQWNTLSQRLSFISLEPYNNDKFFITTQENYAKELGGEWLDILQFVLSPFGIARIQKSIIELVLRGVLSLSDNQWKICVIERDVPCAKLAIKDLEEFFEKLFELENQNRKLPKVELKVYSSNEFISATLNKDYSDIDLIEKLEYDNTIYDVVLDVSVLQRSRLSPQLKFANPQSSYFKIRSAHTTREKRQVLSADLITYPKIVSTSNDGSYSEIDKYKRTLEYFLINIFRKEEFLTGQLPILDRALSRKDLVGLLPTGGGKSLTYQIASLLQPGMTIVIDPIKSLMKDQVDGLARNLIDFCDYLNSSKRGIDKRKTLSRIGNAEVMYIFVSPERLQMKEFRDILDSLFKNNHFFSYCVIDEAHCVSEWGHDFRTSYLFLGKNARRYSKTKDRLRLPIFALTATASFDVLADILKELSDEITQINSDAIVRFETTNRPEIQYKVERIEIIPNNNNIFDLKQQIGQAKQQRINELLSRIPFDINKYNTIGAAGEIFNEAYKNDPDRIRKYGEKFNEEAEFNRIKIEPYDPNNFWNTDCKNAVIIFCPHRGWYLGVTDKYKNPPGNNAVADNIRGDLQIKEGTFLGTNSDDQTVGREIDRDNNKYQDAFIDNRINLMISTKAFGMGIDKPNIRASIHLNYPQSIESFVQESGRIGRDGKLAIAYILFNEQEFNVAGRLANVNIDEDILNDFHSNSFRGELKEKVILNQLLNTNVFPKYTNIDLLNYFLEDENYEAECKLKLINGNWRIYIDKAFQEEYGFILLPNLISNFHNCNQDQNLAEEIHRKVINYIITENNAGLIPQDWLMQIVEQREQPSIEEILHGNHKQDIIIGFKNDWMQVCGEIARFVNRVSNTHYNEQSIRDKIKYGNKRITKFEDFYNELNINFNQENKDRLEKIFYKIRDVQDTAKGIYRLSILGLIDEYEVDYQSYFYNVTISPRNEIELESLVKEKLYDHLRKYYSEQRVLNELESVPRYPTIDENNYLHKAIAFLIDFIYREIAVKRKLAITDIKTAISKYGSTNASFKDYIYYYFNSKYARRGYEENGKNRSLYDRLYDQNNYPKGNADTIDLVWEFVGYVGNDVNNFRHLRGACIRLLQLPASSNYYSLRFLKAYSILVIEQNNELILEEGVKDFSRGLELYYKQIAQNNRMHFKFIDSFVQKIAEQTNNEISEKIIQCVRTEKLKAHVKWLKETNKKLGDVNGRRTAQTTS